MKIVDIPVEKAKCVLSVQKGDLIEEMEQKFSFQQFLTGACDSYKMFASDVKNVRQYDKIMKVVESLKEDDRQIRFEDADFEVVKAAINACQWAHPKIGRSYLPFYDAIEKAQDVKA